MVRWSRSLNCPEGFWRLRRQVIYDLFMRRGLLFVIIILGREGRRRSHGAEEVAAPLTRTNDSHFKRHLTLFSAPGNNGNLHIKFDSRRWVPVDRWWLVSRWMCGRVSLHGCIKVALSCTITTCLKSLVSRGTETIYYLQFFLSLLFTHTRYNFFSDVLCFNRKNICLFHTFLKYRE